MITRPMLAETVEDINTIIFPVLASPKLDGIRCVIPEKTPLSRKFKPIPNNRIRGMLAMLELAGHDGELITFTDGKMDEFNTIQSKVMSEDGDPDFTFCVFDYVLDGDLTCKYEKRLALLEQKGHQIRQVPNNEQFVQVVQHVLINSVEELIAYEQKIVDMGFEGVMIRSLDGQYKLGRSTLKQGWLLKVKRFLDDEAEVIGFTEQMSNTNEKEVNELGLSKRSSKKAGMIPAGRLGEFNVRDLKTGVEFQVGTGLGLTLEMRQEIWDNQAKYLGKIIKYKHQPSGAKKDGKPRFPVWLGFRDARDMD